MRFFSFGCSFTNYKWPTWADILAQDFDYFENWGKESSGNHHIMYSLVECINRNKLSKEDYVCIMWSGVERETAFANDEWIHTKNQNKSDYKGYLLLTLPLISAARMMLDNIGCKYHFFTMTDINSEYEDINDVYTDVFDLIYPSIYEIVFQRDWQSRPDLMVHYNISPKQESVGHLKESYNDCRGKDWPSVEDFLNRDFSSTRREVIDEIANLNFFNWLADIYSNKSDKFKKIVDLHPTPAGHAEYLEKIGFCLSNNQQEYVCDWNAKVLSGNYSFNPRSMRTLRFGRNR